MDDLTPGRDLNRRVAQALYGGNPVIWRDYSTDREAALSLLDALAGRGWHWSIAYRPVSPGQDYEAALYHPDEQEAGEAFAPAATLPLAICAAVLAALLGADQ